MTTSQKSIMCDDEGFHCILMSLSLCLSFSRTGWSVSLDVSSPFCSSATGEASKFGP